MENAMSIDIVIVNWNTGDHLRKCVASIDRFGFELASRVIVVDNGSRDDSLQGFRDLRTPMTVQTNGVNLGFARGCNQGAALGNARYILFLNPDTELTTESLSIPEAFMDDPIHESTAVCGIQLVNEHNQISRSCARFPTLLRFLARIIGIDRLPGHKSSSTTMLGWDHRDTRRVDQVMGAFFFVKRKIFDAMMGFDERFFVYFEEVDFSRRAFDLGYDSIYLSDAKALHVGGASSRKVVDRRLFYSIRSRLLYALKHFGLAQRWLLVWSTLTIEPVTRVMNGILRLDPYHVRDVCRAFLWVYRSYHTFFKAGSDRT